MSPTPIHEAVAAVADCKKSDSDPAAFSAVAAVLPKPITMALDVNSISPEGIRARLTLLPTSPGRQRRRPFLLCHQAWIEYRSPEIQ